MGTVESVLELFKGYLSASVVSNPREQGCPQRLWPPDMCRLLVIGDTNTVDRTLGLAPNSM